VPDDDTGSRLLAARQAEEAAGTEPAPESEEELLPELEAVDVPDAGATVREHGTEAPREAPPARPAAPRVLAQPLEEEEATTPAVSRAWSFGVVLLLLVIGAELAFAFRAPLAQRYPPLRPYLESACARAGCAVPWPRDERLLKLEDSELLEVPGRPGEIALGARIRNLAGVAQEYPHLELTLTDVSGQVAARRVLRPSDYLGRAVRRDDVLAGGAEVAIQLRLQTPGIKPTGYELLLFYP